MTKMLSDQSIKGLTVETREKILDAALKLFIKEGFSASTNSITKEAGLSTGLLFHYFPTKLDLILCLYSQFRYEYFEGTTRLEKAIGEKDPAKYIRIHKDAFYNVITWCLDNWPKYQFIQLFDGSLLANQFDLTENDKLNKISTMVNTVLQSGIDQGIFKPLSSVFIIKVMFEVHNAIIEYLHDHPEYREDPEFMEEAWKIYWSTCAR